MPDTVPDGDCHDDDRPLVVVMGVSGSGKTTVGRALAERLGVPFEDGDDLHPEANVAKMARGEPLDDADRHPWLDRVGAWLAERQHGAGHTADAAAGVADPGGAGGGRGTGGVVACSALKRRYRDQLRGHVHDLDFLLLHGDRAVLQARLDARRGHFMPAGLLTSQLSTLEPLEPDEHGRVIDVDQSVDAIVEEYVRETRRDTQEAP